MCINLIKGDRTNTHHYIYIYMFRIINYPSNDELGIIFHLFLLDAIILIFASPSIPPALCKRLPTESKTSINYLL